MRKTRAAALAAMVMAVAVFVSGCTTFNNFKDTFFADKGAKSDTIKIGILEPQTGNDSAKGEVEIQGIELANTMVPKVLGKDIELVYADTQSSIYVAETAVEDLIEKKPAVVLGSYGDAVSLIASQKLGKKKIPAIAITASNPLITANNDYYFRVNFTDSSQGRALAEYVYDSLKLKQAGVVKLRGEDTSTEMVSQFTDRLRDLTGDEDCILASLEIPQDAEDYGQYALKLAESGVKAVFMPISLKHAAQMFEAAQDIGLQDITFIGPKDWHTDELIRLQSEYPGIKIAVASDFAANAKKDAKTTALHDRFLEAYKKEYGKEEPPEEVAMGFDAYMIAVKALDQAGTTDGTKVKEALQSIKNFGGASGEISFNESGEPKKSINVDVIADGKYVSVYTVE